MAAFYSFVMRWLVWFVSIIFVNLSPSFQTNIMLIFNHPEVKLQVGDKLTTLPAAGL